MIKDYNNPHPDIYPTEIITEPTTRKFYRVTRKQGFHHVEATERKDWSYYPVLDYRTNKPAIFPTIGEAENFIKADSSETKIYYYDDLNKTI